MNVFDYPMELGDYWHIILRRKWHFLVPFVLVLGVAAAIAFYLPAVFRSEATLLIERQTIPQNLISTTVSGYVQEQIAQIRERIVTNDNLREVAEEFYLYPEEMEDDPVTTLKKIRDDVEVVMQDVEAKDPDQGGVRYATIAFNVAFSAESPRVARDVANSLAGRFLEINKAAREARAAEVEAFLDDEAEKLRVEIADLEQLLAGFKQEELRQLPELMDMNLNLFERTEQQIQQTEDRIRQLTDNINTIRAELSLTEPYKDVRTEDGRTLLSASERLSSLTAEYMRATARYSNEHPDVIRLAREIRILAEQAGNSERTDEIMNQLVNLQEQLRQARQKYSDDHPEVQNLEKSVAALQRGFESALLNSANGLQAAKTPPDNPRYVALKTQLDATESNLEAERQKLLMLNEKLTEYETRLYQTPVVERDYKSLSRDYSNAVAKYQELREKTLQARLAEQLESGESAEKFVIVSPAYLPVLPDSPNRIGILLLGFIFGAAVGLAVVTAAEYLDKTIRNARMIASALGVPPLAVIPKMRWER